MEHCLTGRRWEQHSLSTSSHWHTVSYVSIFENNLNLLRSADDIISIGPFTFHHIRLRKSGSECKASHWQQDQNMIPWWKQSHNHFPRQTTSSNHSGRNWELFCLQWEIKSSEEVYSGWCTRNPALICCLTWMETQLCISAQMKCLTLSQHLTESSSQGKSPDRGWITFLEAGECLSPEHIV